MKRKQQDVRTFRVVEQLVGQLLIMICVLSSWSSTRQSRFLGSGAFF